VLRDAKAVAGDPVGPQHLVNSSDSGVGAATAGSHAYSEAEVAPMHGLHYTVN
jgi:hypothetical protein